MARFHSMRSVTLPYVRSAALLLAFSVIGGVQADTPQPRFKLGPWTGDLEVGARMNAANRNLRGSEFVGQDLSGAVFDGSDLHEVHFWDCDLSAASFRSADLSGAVIEECSRIRGADFTDATVTGLVADYSLSPMQLRSTRSYKVKDLRNCRAISAAERDGTWGKPVLDFAGAVLTGARLNYGDFSACDFTDARIDRIELHACRMTFRQLASTKNYRDRSLRNMRFSMTLDEDPDFTGMDLTGTQLGVGRGRHARLSEATIVECTFGPMLRKEDLYATKSYRDGDLRGIQFQQIDMAGWDLSGQNLTGCTFWGCNLAGANLDDAVISGVTISAGLAGPSAITIDPIEATWNYRHGHMNGIVLPDELSAALGTR